MGQEDGGLVNLEAEIEMSRSGFWRWLEEEKELMMSAVILISLYRSRRMLFIICVITR